MVKMKTKNPAGDGGVFLFVQIRPQSCGPAPVDLVVKRRFAPPCGMKASVPRMWMSAFNRPADATRTSRQVRKVP